MNEFLRSIKSDLLSRRLLPFVALAAIALIAAVAFTVGGGSSSTPPAPSVNVPNVPIGGAGTLAVAVAPANPNEAVSETPGGSRYQSQGPTRDPFVPLPSPPAKTENATGANPSSGPSTGGSTSGGSSQGGSSGGSGSGGAPTEPAPAPAPAPKKSSKPKLEYDVSVLFGPASTTPGQPATLTPYQSLKLGEPFPSKQDVRISFQRVSVNGKGAIFKLVLPPILHGNGFCLPSNSECETIDLEAGHVEELEYLEASGQVAVYELKVVSIAKKNSAAAARAARRAKAATRRAKAARAKAARAARTALHARD